MLLNIIDSVIMMLTVVKTEDQDYRASARKNSFNYYCIVTWKVCFMILNHVRISTHGGTDNMQSLPAAKHWIQ